MYIVFRDTADGVNLGGIEVPFETITKLERGDLIEFKEIGALFGLYEIESFAVNQGAPEGTVNLKSLRAKASIKLSRINDEYLDSFLPF